MHTNLDESICDQFEDEIATVLKKNDVDVTPQEAALSLMGASAGVIASISCKDCRVLAAKWALETFPDIIGEAMKFAAEKFGDDPPIGHVH